MTISELEKKNAGLIFNGDAGYKQPVVSDVRLEISRADICLLTGPNGAGKTTLLKTLAGIHSPYSGTVINMFYRTAFVPQISDIEKAYPLKVCDAVSLADPVNMRIFSMFRGDHRVRKKKLSSILDFTGLNHRRNLLLRECSGGELQRVLIARALITDPELLILDEPTGSIDHEGKEEIMKLLIRVRDEKHTAILMTSHEMNVESARFFNRKLIVESGKLTEVRYV